MKSIVYIAVVLLFFSACASSSVHYYDNDGENNFEEYPIEYPADIPIVTDYVPAEYGAHFTMLPQAQELFPPIDVPIFERAPWGYSVPHGMPEAVRHYHFGEIHAPPIDGMANFLVLVRDGFSAWQEPNLLRIAPEGDAPTAIMEITQLPNITIEEAKYKILADIDRSIYNVSYHINASFAGITITRRESERPRIRYEAAIRAAEPYRSIRLECNRHGGVFMHTMHLRLQEDYFDIHRELWSILELKEQFPHGLESFRSYPSNAIQEMFEPILAFMQVPETSVFIALEPFGKISETEGIASYAFYINTTNRQIEQSVNTLRIDTVRQPAPSYMEITQIPNITKEEKIHAILSAADFFLDEWQLIEGFTQFSYYAPHEWNSIATHIFIKDNGLGGVFVITMHYTAEPFCGCPGYASFVQYFNALRTLQIIE